MFEILAAIALTVFQASYVLDPVAQPENAIYIHRPHQNAQVSEQVRVKPFSEIKWKNVVRQRYDFSCGSAAISTILKHYIGEDITELNAMRGMLRHGERQQIIERQGFSLLDMKRYVSFLGYESGGFRADISDLRDLERPVIVPIQYGGFKHFVVLREMMAGRAFIADPAFGNFTMPITRFENIWEPDVLFMTFRGDREAINDLQLQDQDLRYLSITAPEGHGVALEQFRSQNLLDKSADRALKNFKFF